MGAVEISSLRLRYDYDTRLTVQQSYGRRPKLDVQILMAGEEGLMAGEKLTVSLGPRWLRACSRLIRELID